MQNQFIGILNRQEFRFGAYDIGKGKTRIQMNGESQLQRWVEEIGFKNPKHREKADSGGWI
ncbi:MAG: hypothetical protein SVU88_03695, partial [Candidatus Nanohaloarchaea archaeon]|nr:hypothetical protein [Candidatus Nanohaloarchaea archaeon]